jgi:hypothetical protein
MARKAWGWAKEGDSTGFQPSAGTVLTNQAPRVPSFHDQWTSCPLVPYCILLGMADESCHAHTGRSLAGVAHLLNSDSVGPR